MVLVYQYAHEVVDLFLHEENYLVHVSVFVVQVLLIDVGLDFELEKLNFVILFLHHRQDSHCPPLPSFPLLPLQHLYLQQINQPHLLEQLEQLGLQELLKPLLRLDLRPHYHNLHIHLHWMVR